jgi:hypothetical protein
LLDVYGTGKEKARQVAVDCGMMGPQVMGDTQQPSCVVCAVILLLPLLLLFTVYCTVHAVQEAPDGCVCRDLKSDQLLLLLKYRVQCFIGTPCTERRIRY